jgi:hypothetical protein
MERQIQREIYIEIDSEILREKETKSKIKFYLNKNNNNNINKNHNNNNNNNNNNIYHNKTIEICSYILLNIIKINQGQSKKKI